MNRLKNRALSVFVILPLFITFLLSSCMTASALKGQPGIDITSVKPGISRVEAEKILGSPLREWMSSDIRYCVYAYDGGIPPNASDAAAFAFLEIISVGLLDLYEAIGASELTKIRNKVSRIAEKIAVSYDVDAIIIGVFDHFGDFDVLPADGRAGK